MSLFFVQDRIGESWKLFPCLKLRTMRRNAQIIPMTQKKDPNDPRVLPSRRWMRRSGIDEIPQLINVILGDMNFIGPRPLAEYEIGKLSDNKRTRRLRQKPGLLGSYTCLDRTWGDLEKSHDFFCRLLYKKRDDNLTQMLHFRIWIIRESLRAVLGGKVH